MKKTLYKFGGVVVVGLIMYSIYSDGLSRAVESLPAPRGSYEVGLEVHTTKHNNASLWIWYPSEKVGRWHNQYGDREALKNFTRALAKDQPWSMRFFAQINEYMNLWGSESPSQRNAPLSNKQKQYPVIFFIPEGATPPFLYSALSENLASHGFVVVGVSDPQQSFGGDIIHETGIMPHIQQPDDESEWETAVQSSVANCMQAIAYVENLTKYRNSLHQWHGRLNLDAYGCYGFAWNSLVPIFLCDKDPRCKAGAMINGWIDVTLPQAFTAPLLLVCCETEANIYVECFLESFKKSHTAPDSVDYLTVVCAPDSNYCSFSDLACAITPIAHLYPKQTHPHARLSAVGKDLAQFFAENLNATKIQNN